MKKLPYLNILRNAIVAFFIYASWTYFVNNIGALFSAMTQGIMSFSITIVLSIYLEFVFNLAKNKIELFMYVLLWMGIVVFIQIIIHNIICTENIFITILPGLIISFIYIAIYLCNKITSGRLKLCLKIKN